MVDISFDTSELRSFAADLEKAPTTAIVKLKPVIKKAGMNIKKQMRAEMASSGSFGALARSINFDVVDGGLGVEVGPSKKSGGSRGLGFGANIAYFGGANGGGGSVADPKGALDAEIPNFESEVDKILGDLLG